MSVSHLELIRKLLEKNHWKINKENEFSWDISRPNGDTPLKLDFPAWYGCMGEYKETDIEKSISCEVDNYPEIDFLYFGKFSKKFQTDVLEFIEKINKIEKR